MTWFWEGLSSHQSKNLLLFAFNVIGILTAFLRHLYGILTEVYRHIIVISIFHYILLHLTTEISCFHRQVSLLFYIFFSILVSIWFTLFAQVWFTLLNYFWFTLWHSHNILPRHDFNSIYQSFHSPFKFLIDFI